MNPINGTDVVLSIFKDGDYYPFICAMDCSFNPTLTTKPVRTLGDGKWKKPRGQSFAYTISLSGLITMPQENPTAFWLLENYFMQMLPLQYRMIFTDADTSLVTIIQGTALIVSAPFNGPVQDFANAAFEMEGDGIPQLLYSATICEASIGSLEVSGTGDDNVTINYAGVMFADRLDYTVDGGGRETIFSPGANGSFTIGGLSEGSHTVVVYPVCFNGIDGDANSVTFEITGGGVEVCNPPTGLAMGTVATNFAEVAWMPPTPNPFNFEWELYLSINLSTPVQTGTSAGDFETLNSLISGTGYLFRIRSICSPGSMSSWASISFTTASPVACNAPGAPSFSSITTTSATASWTAASPVPAGGYNWQLLQGVTVVNSGNTSSTSVPLSGLTPGTSYTFRVQSACAGGGTSSWSANSFTTTVNTTNGIVWNFDPAGQVASLNIYKNGVLVVTSTNNEGGTFTATNGDLIDVVVNSGSFAATIIAQDTTTATTVMNESAVGLVSGDFTTASGHDYSIIAQIEP